MPDAPVGRLTKPKPISLTVGGEVVAGTPAIHPYYFSFDTQGKCGHFLKKKGCKRARGCFWNGNLCVPSGARERWANVIMNDIALIILDDAQPDVEKVSLSDTGAAGGCRCSPLPPPTRGGGGPRACAPRPPPPRPRPPPPPPAPPPRPPAASPPSPFRCPPPSRPAPRRQDEPSGRGVTLAVDDQTRAVEPHAPPPPAAPPPPPAWEDKKRPRGRGRGAPRGPGSSVRRQSGALGGPRGPGGLRGGNS